MEGSFTYNQIIALSYKYRSVSPLVYLRMSYFAQYLYLELVRAGIICISVFKAGKSQLKMRNLEEKSLLLSVVQVP